MEVKNMQTLFPTALSVSRDLEVYPICNYKWFLMRCCRLYKYASNVDLEAGSEFAKAMEIVRNAFYKDGLSEQDAVQLGVDNILTRYALTYNENPWKESVKSPEKMAEVLRMMFKENSMEDTTIVPFEMLDGELSVEQEFQVELPYMNPDTGKPIILKGLLDMLGMRGDTVFGVDEKTCKSVLTDAIAQADLLRTSNQFVCYVNLANKNKEKFGDVEVTHFKIHKCKVKDKYTPTENVVEGYEFLIDIWFQKAWWNNMLYQVQDMVDKYLKFKAAQEYVNSYQADNNDYDAEFDLHSVQNTVFFPRSYGHACTLFFKPCVFTYHCTSGSAQNLYEQGFNQVVSESGTHGMKVPLHDWRRHILEGVPLEDVLPKVEVIDENNKITFDDFLGTF